MAKIAEINLKIAMRPVKGIGETTHKITINNQFPAPTLRFQEGDEAVVHVHNQMDQKTSIHWHGLLLDGSQDGVAGFNGYQEIAPHQNFTYRFPIRQAGTYWYHAHTQGQEQDGLYGGIVIKPKKHDPYTYHRDYIVLLSDFSHESAAQILGNLKKSSDYYANQRLTIPDFIKQAQDKGFGKAWQDATDWGKMRMMRTDLSDVTGYSFLINGSPSHTPWAGLFKKGETVRLRFINASAMSFFDVRIPDVKMQVIEADGQPIKPVLIDEFRFAPAETYDVLVSPIIDKAYTIVAEPIDRSGFALATLTPKAGMKATIPDQRPREMLKMGDMNMNKMMQDDPDMEMTDETMQTGWDNASTPKGHQALSYGDLQYRGKQPHTPPVHRTINMRLGGNMERYIWTMNGKNFSDAPPIHVTQGEHVRIKFINETMMAHPMHLHGLFMQLENSDNKASLPNKHTVIVPPGQEVSVLVHATEVGEWAFHCHLLYHMASGMMQKLIISPKGKNHTVTEPNKKMQDSMPKHHMGGHHAHH